ncbi:hypothetical protein [Streptomyces bauhiniae]|uniref:hypothetical protein n=1 Tax=Streptomyces bauhiniae TaxID=2340725 RepID=UPI0034556EBD
MRSTRARRLVALSATGLLLAGGAAVGAAGTASATQNGHHSSYDRDYRDGHHNRYNHDRGWWNDDDWGRHHNGHHNNWNNWGDYDNNWGGHGHNGYGHGGYGHGGHGGYGGGHGGGHGGGGHGGGGHGR